MPHRAILLEMTLDAFQALPEPDQLAAVYAAGTLVARRW